VVFVHAVIPAWISSFAGTAQPAYVSRPGPRWIRASGSRSSWVFKVLRDLRPFRCRPVFNSSERAPSSAWWKP